MRRSPPTALLFLDPPYLEKARIFNPHLKRQGLSGAAYACGDSWDLERHRELCKFLRTRERWILCHSDHPEIRTMYDGFHIVDYRDGKQWSKSSKVGRIELLVLSP